MEMKERLFKLGGDVKHTAGKLAKGAVDGSKKMAEKVRIKNAISHAESRLNAAYMEIGKKYEELHENDTESEFAELLGTAADAKAQIVELKTELAAVDSASICPNCGKYVQEGQRFCPACGTKQPEPPEEAPEEETPAEEETAGEVVEEAAAEEAAPAETEVTE